MKTAKRSLSVSLWGILLAAPSGALAQTHELVELGTLGGDFSSASEANGVGDVAGTSVTRDLETHAFVWTGTKKLEDLGTLGGGSSFPGAIGDGGEVVGTSRTASGQSHAFLWDPSSGMQDLGTLGGAFSDARDVSSSLEVVGASGLSDDGFSTAPFLWTQADGMIDLGTLGGLRGAAVDINDSSEVAGRSLNAEGEHRAFLWSASTGMVDLGPANRVAGINDLGQVAGTEDGTPFIATVNGRTALPVLSGASAARVWAINNRGEVAGTSARRAVLWDASGAIIDLGTLGGSSSSARDVNDLGAVVGRSTTPDGATHAFYWTADTGMIDLGSIPDDGADKSTARAIGSDGTIAGHSRTSDGTRAVAWVPLEEDLALLDEIAALLDLVRSGHPQELSKGTAKSLEAKLLALNDAIQRGATSAVIGNLIDSMVRQIEALRSAGRISDALADDLVNGLLDLRASYA